MGLALSVPIATARGLLNDPSSVRYTAADLLVYANDALDQLARLVPQLFYTDGTLTCVNGTATQTLSFNTALALIDVRRVQGGNVVSEVDRAALDSFNPAWRSTTPAAAVHWMRIPGEPLKFLIYPPAATSQVLEVTYVKVPEEHIVSADTGLPTALSDAIADYIVYRAESRDDEHVLSARAVQFLASFQSKVTA